MTFPGGDVGGAGLSEEAGHIHLLAEVSPAELWIQRSVSRSTPRATQRNMRAPQSSSRSGARPHQRDESKSSDESTREAGSIAPDAPTGCLLVHGLLPRPFALMELDVENLVHILFPRPGLRNDLQLTPKFSSRLINFLSELPSSCRHVANDPRDAGKEWFRGRSVEEDNL
jgi:hypothetical protein